MHRPIVELVRHRGLLVGMIAAALLGGGITALSQPPGAAGPKDATGPAKKAEQKPKAAKPAAASLEEMLTQALRNNPDIRLAATKVREADAELQRTRLQVTQKIVTLYHAREAQQILVRTAEAMVQSARATGDKLIVAKAKLAEIEAEINYLLGKQPARGQGVAVMDFDGDGLLDLFVANATAAGSALYHNNGDGTFTDVTQRARAASLLNALAERRGARPTVHGTMAEKIRKALDLPVTLRGEAAPLVEIVWMLQGKAGVAIEIGGGENLGGTGVTLNLTNVPLGAALQAIEDKFAAVRPDARNADMEYQPAIRIAVRAYGLLIIPENRLPPGAVLMEEFWKGDVGKEKSKAAPQGK
jgi:hypothetical protein